MRAHDPALHPVNTPSWLDPDNHCIRIARLKTIHWIRFEGERLEVFAVAGIGHLGKGGCRLRGPRAGRMGGTVRRRRGSCGEGGGRHCSFLAGRFAGRKSGSALESGQSAFLVDLVCAIRKSHSGNRIDKRSCEAALCQGNDVGQQV